MTYTCIMTSQLYPIYFITSNQRKFASLQKLLQPLDIDLQQLDHDFDEGRGLDIQTIAKSKLAQAKKAFPNKRLIVDDRGFFHPSTERLSRAVR